MSQYLDLYVVGMLKRAESLIPTLVPLPSDSAAYGRISDDPEGHEHGVTRQVEDARSLAAGDGVDIPDECVFTDDDISASTLSRKPRPDFERLLAYVMAGQVKRVYAYSNSRLTRRPMELEVLIQVHQKYGLKIRTKVSGDDDLGTSDGRMTARIKAAVDAAEAERTGERVKRQKEQRLASGMPPGSRYRTFGYTQSNVAKGIPGWELIPEEAEIVREVFQRVADGESVRSVTADLIERDVRRVSSQPWQYQSTLRMLESRIYAGRLSYKGEDAGEAHEGIPRLVTETVFDAAQGRQRKGAWNTRSGLFSGIAICGNCQTGMVVDAKGYTCPRLGGGCGSVRIKREWIDEHVQSAVRFLIMWKRAQYVEKPSETVETGRTIEDIDREIQEVQDARIAGDLDLADALPMLKGLRAERAKIAESQLAAEDEQASAWATMDEYDAADLSMKRSIIKRHIVAVPVLPTSNPGINRFDPARFSVVTTYARTLTGEQCVRLADLAMFRSTGIVGPAVAEGLDPADWAIDHIWGRIEHENIEHVS